MPRIGHLAGMVKVSEIVDRDSLEAWLKSQPVELIKPFSVKVASRASLRMLPDMWGSVQYRGGIKGKNRDPLPFLRCELNTFIEAVFPSQENRNAAKNAEKIASSILGAPMAETRIDAVLNVTNAVLSAINDTDKAAFFASCVGANFFFGETAQAVVNKYFWSEIQADCETLSSGADRAIWPLWKNSRDPLNEYWGKIRSWILSNSEVSGSVDWSFWINWYQDVLEGREPDWDMLYEIALIPDEDWEKGPEHINNEVIAGIVEKYRLRRDVQALRKELAAVHQTATAAPMGHNNPPEGIEAEAEVVTQTEIIWAALEEAEEELSKPEPSPSVLKRVGTVILRAIAEVGKYGAKLGDVGLKATAATVGGGLGAYLISKGPEIQSIAERISEFVWP